MQTEQRKAISRIKLTLQVVKVNPDGLEDVRAVEVNSWLRGWADILSTMFQTNLTTGGSTAGVVDTGGAARTVEQANPGVDSEGPRANSAAADTTIGIQVGLTATPVDRDDNALALLIAEGTGLDQLNYLATTFNNVVAPIAGGYRISISRQVNNNSALTVTVREIGLAVLHRIAGPSTANFLILRDLVTEAIPATESRIFRYHMDFIA